MAAADLDDISERLYALPPDEFTAARDAEAKQAADKELRAAVKALRRPTVSAWLVNLLAAEQPDLLDQLLDLGPALASAQQEGRGDALRDLGQQRRELVAAVAGTAVGLGARPVTAQVRLEVEQTLEAALADPASADAVRSGRLVRALTYAGFGDVDLEDAVAVSGSRRPTRTEPAAPRKTGSKQKTERKDDDAVAAAETAALDAAAALDDAVRACEAAERERTEAEASAAEAAEDAERAAADVARLEQELAAARERGVESQETADATRRRADAAAATTSEAGAAVAAAQEAAERARAELDQLRRA